MNFFFWQWSRLSIAARKWFKFNTRSGDTIKIVLTINKLQKRWKIITNIFLIPLGTIQYSMIAKSRRRSFCQFVSCFFQVYSINTAPRGSRYLEVVSYLVIISLFYWINRMCEMLCNSILSVKLGPYFQEYTGLGFKTALPLRTHLKC